MTARTPKAKPPRADTQTVRLTREEMWRAADVREVIAEESPTGTIRALLLAAKEASDEGDIKWMERVRDAGKRIRDDAEKPAPVVLRGRARKSKPAR